MTQLAYTCAGFCPRCQTVHRLPTKRAKNAALELITTLDRENRLDFHLPPGQANYRYSTDYLFGKARGKMFGTLICQDAAGVQVTLKAFSGQYNGAWDIEGWVPPLFDLHAWHCVQDDTEKEIKKIGVQIDSLEKNAPQRAVLIHKRRNLSRELMGKIHQLYRLHNFSNDARLLSDVYRGKNGIPNGTADCCGPKLLSFAARHQLKPLAIAEFYYGRENKQGDRIHGRFYPACQDKCAPILGYMLCGIDPDMTSIA